MKKVYDHAVIYNGVFYSADTPIEVETAEVVKPEPKAVKENADKQTGRKSKTRDNAD